VEISVVGSFNRICLLLTFFSRIESRNKYPSIRGRCNGRNKQQTAEQRFFCPPPPPQISNQNTFPQGVGPKKVCSEKSDEWNFERPPMLALAASWAGGRRRRDEKTVYS
jgi:hypothetical protein